MCHVFMSDILSAENRKYMILVSPLLWVQQVRSVILTVDCPV